MVGHNIYLLKQIFYRKQSLRTHVVLLLNKQAIQIRRLTPKPM